MIEIDIGIVRPELRLRVPASEDSLPLVRQALRSLGETVDANLDALEDAELAVTEAMANAVEHAYEGGKGEVRVTLDPEDTDITVVVSDDGQGIPEDVQRREGRGFGLSMIEGIAAKMEVRGGDGTDVSMTFAMGRSEVETVDGGAPGIDPTERLLRRLVAVAAAQLDMPSDRVVEALLVAELVARNSLRYLTGDTAAVSLARTNGGFELRVGPLEEGGAQAAIDDSDVPVVGRVIERLTDAMAVEQDEDGTERLMLRIG
jgi:serine/threonine-protein kinase RsbW